jgi:AraC-like DNA-binding protein
MSALMMRIAGLEGYQALVSELGGDAISLIEEAELQLDSFDQPDFLIPAWKACKLLELSAEHLTTPNFGLLLAKRQNLSMLGPLGLMLQHSETLEHALQDLNKFLYVHSQAGNINLSSNGNLVNITYSPLVSYHNSAKQLIDLSLAVGFSILSSLSNRRFPLVSAYFTYKTPDDAAIYRDFFACPVIFSAAENGVTILRSVLENSLTQQKQDVRGFFNDYLKNKESALRPGIDESLRILIRQLLPLGKCRLDIVSSALAIDKRTLQRRLKEIDTSFKALVDIERRQIAMQYIKESDLSMAQISDLLGYTDPSIFSRNFKNWFGLAPAEYVKAHRLRWKYRS